MVLLGGFLTFCLAFTAFSLSLFRCFTRLFTSLTGFFTALSLRRSLRAALYWRSAFSLAWNGILSTIDVWYETSLDFFSHCFSSRQFLSWVLTTISRELQHGFDVELVRLVVLGVIDCIFIIQHAHGGDIGIRNIALEFIGTQKMGNVHFSILLKVYSRLVRPSVTWLIKG
nr:MAG TPA: hypothetical protein [Caudoviricetes sp.]